MASFIGTSGDDILNAVTGTIVGFTGGSLGELQDGIGDTIQGGLNFDVIVAGNGSDTIFGNTSASPDGSIVGDSIDGGGGADSITGSSGDDTIFGGLSTDTINGGSGADLVIIRDGEFIDDVNGGAGDDTVDLSLITTAGRGVIWDFDAGTYHLADDFGGTRNISSIQAVIGTQLDDAFSSTFGTQTVSGAGGNDTLSVGDGMFVDVFDGGDGTDQIDLSAYDVEAVTLNLAAGTYSVSGLNASTLTDVENAKGGGGNDSLTGSTIANQLKGGGGSDTLNGGDGDDDLQGGTESDTINGGNGNDLIFANVSTNVDASPDGDSINGGTGNDTITGSGGADTVDGSSDDDSINGGSGDDNLSGNFGSDTILGGFGNDTIFADINGFITSDTLFNDLRGEDGSDSIIGSAGGENIDGGSGNDTMSGNGGNDTISGGSGSDSINAGSGDDALQAGFNEDTVNGDAGDDTLTVLDGEFIDIFDGGTETDTADLSNYLSAVSIDLGAGTWIGLNSSTLANVENANGGNGADTINGSSASNVLNGNGGADTINGGAGDDAMSGGGGDDNFILATGDGSDTAIDGGTEIDKLIIQSVVSGLGTNFTSIEEVEFSDAAGADNIYTVLASEFGSGLVGNLLVDFAAAGFRERLAINMGSDTSLNLSGLTFQDVTTADKDGILVQGDTDAENIKGSSIRDQLNGSGGNDVISGGGGKDDIAGGLGNDKLTGGSGKDILTGGGGNDTYTVDRVGEAKEDVGGGTDTVKANFSYVLEANIEKLVLTGSGNFNGTGNGLNNGLQGNGGNNKLTGLGGNDNLSGGNGNDLLIGGLGKDVMNGGGGDDVFDFNATSESGTTSTTRDKIAGFDAGTGITTIDRIDLSTIDANNGAGGNQAFIFGGAFTAGHLKVTQSGTSVLVSINTDADSAAEMVIQIQNTLVGNFNASDFIL